MSPLKRAVFIFVLICAMGLFSALASGVQWGTPVAGIITAFTFFVATLVAGAVYENDMWGE
ncbi:hypothetical protein RS536_002907 [Salmonella enterica]|nr:hypothetical protein [Salmonella enterica subsp. enterica serovar Duisburg]EAP0826164.1 hypothetical protein [Salmonella enterica]EKB3332447.1 hypothetical protein [Salmonella enterica subsp. enterica serovar Chandans]OIN15742.1 hypothetical protein AO411_2005365 [Salmonella enterica subsp. enterica serovar Sarajane]EAQ9959210.1 hypothetical protein [Salmonella enterica]